MPNMSQHTRFVASVTFTRDPSPGGIVATAMRVLLAAGPAATGCTLINPDGTAHYISRADAERCVHDPILSEAHQ
jgi:hypothetical protein